jgi:hypothetical protein
MSDLALTFFQVLQEAGVSQDRATAAAESLNKTINEQFRMQSCELATKTDLATLKYELVRWIVGAGIAAVVALFGLVQAVL